MHKVTLALPLSLLANRGGAARGLLQHRCKTRVVAYNVTPGLGEEGTLLERVMRHRAPFPEPSMPPRAAEDSEEAGV